MSEKAFIKAPKGSINQREITNQGDTEILVENKTGGIMISDGYHTMDELYDHRITLFIALCRSIEAAIKAYLNLGLEPELMIPVWRSKVNGDGTTWDGWFVLGIYKENGKQITYHLPLDRWDETDFAETLDQAPDFDGHTSEDVLKRLAIL